MPTKARVTTVPSDAGTGSARELLGCGVTCGGRGIVRTLQQRTQTLSRSLCETPEAEAKYLGNQNATRRDFKCALRFGGRRGVPGFHSLRDGISLTRLGYAQGELAMPG